MCRGIRFIPGSHDLVLDGGASASSAAGNSVEPGGAMMGASGDQEYLAQVVREAAILWWNDTMTNEEIQEQSIDAGFFHASAAEQLLTAD